MLIVWLGWWNDATTRSTTPPITETSPENTYIPSTLCVLLPPNQLSMQSTTSCAMSSQPHHHHQHDDADQQPFVNHNAPQCCHCGWRGSHAPHCPSAELISPPRRSYLFLHSPSIRNARYITISHALMHDPLPPASSLVIHIVPPHPTLPLRHRATRHAQTLSDHDHAANMTRDDHVPRRWFRDGVAVLDWGGLIPISGDITFPYPVIASKGKGAWDLDRGR
ncbi:hypothetical protein EDD15DRAFT_318204 [Pisolithus albus]|nr:hypothetical protein EDD15DRAFT_318204 [Pisolithus albus]